MMLASNGTIDVTAKKNATTRYIFIFQCFKSYIDNIEDVLITIVRIKSSYNFQCNLKAIKGSVLRTFLCRRYQETLDGKEMVSMVSMVSSMM